LNGSLNAWEALFLGNSLEYIYLRTISRLSWEEGCNTLWAKTIPILLGKGGERTIEIFLKILPREDT